MLYNDDEFLNTIQELINDGKVLASCPNCKNYLLKITCNCQFCNLDYKPDDVVLKSTEACDFN